MNEWPPTTINFTVHTLPVPQPRHKVGKIGGHARAYIPTEHPIHVFKAAVQQAAGEAYDGEPLTGPLGMTITAWFPRPKIHFGTGRNAGKLKASAPWLYCETNKDWDNIGKAVCDALNKLTYCDDKQIADGRVRKFWTEPGEQPRVDVEIWKEKTKPHSEVR